MRKHIASLILALLFSACQSSKRFGYWGYQLQNYEKKHALTRIYDSKRMLWVIDYSRDGGPEAELSPRQIALLKKNSNTIISYLSIGEAEEGRFYYPHFDQSVIVSQNQEFKDNYKVRYWEPKWQDIFLVDAPKSYGKSYLTRIIDAGFDGVYLDIIDAFYELGKTHKQRIERADQMVDFIARISQFGKARRPDFFVIVQNGTELIRYTRQHAQFWNAIDGVGIESVFFGGPKRNDNDLNIDTRVLENIRYFRGHKKWVVNVEYISTPARIKTFRRLAKQYKFDYPVIGERELKGPLRWLR